MRITYLALLIFMLCSCNKGNNVTIKGDISGMKDSLILAFGNMNSKTGDNVDTIIAHKGEFTYHTQIEKPTCIYLIFPGTQRCPVFVSPGDGVKIKGKAPNYGVLKVKGGDDANDLLNDFKETIKDYYSDNKRVQIEAEKFIRAHKENEVSAFLLDEYFVQSPLFSVEKIRTLMNLLKNSATIDPLVKQISTYLNQRTGLEVGGIAPMFSSTTDKGQTVALSDYKGKYVIVHFWASWEDNFTNEANKLRSLKRRCGSKVSFVGISLDMDRISWKNEIKRDSLSWPQACDFSGFESYMARQFDVTSIPFYILIGPDGRIKQKGVDISIIQNSLSTIINKK